MDIVSAPVLESFNAKAFKSPWMAGRAARFVAASRDLVQTYDLHKGDPIMSVEESTKLDKDFQALANDLTSVRVIKPVTKNDLIAQEERVWAIVESMVDLVGKYDPQKIKNSDMIFGAKAKFSKRREQLTVGRVFFSADMKAAVALSDEVSGAVARHCGGLQQEIMLGYVHARAIVSAVSFNAAVSVVERQLERPSKFGRAYTEQPIYWFGVRLG